MQIKIVRSEFSDVSTISECFIDGEKLCYILEDKVREVPGKPVTEWKVAGKTAIPRGTYSVVVNASVRFKRDLPLLVDVPGYVGVRIHPGNCADDTEGCLLPGLTKDNNFVGHSKDAFAILFDKISAAYARGEHIMISVEGLPE